MLSASEQARLEALLEVKTQSLVQLLDQLIVFEQTHRVSLSVIGSVAEQAYWLDSDLDVYLDEHCSPLTWSAWLDLGESQPKLDAICYPSSTFKQTILEQGKRPAIVKEALQQFTQWHRLIELFPQRRHDKILCTSDNSAHYVAQLRNRMMLITDLSASATPCYDQNRSSTDYAFIYYQPLKQLVFRFVWVVVMLLSRYEQLFSPQGAEVAETVTPEQWRHWFKTLTKSTASRPALVIAQSDVIAGLVAEFYQQIEPNNPDVIRYLNDWLTHYAAFEAAVRHWIAQHWLPQL
jgi:hypothetical protein